jgi:hypothetical protein
MHFAPIALILLLHLALVSAELRKFGDLALDDPKAGDHHSGAASKLLEEAAEQSEPARVQFNNIVNSDPLVSKKNSIATDDSARRLDLANHKIVQAEYHGTRAYFANELARHKKETVKNPFYAGTGGDVPERHPMAEEYHECWGRRHSQVAEQLEASDKDRYRAAIEYNKGLSEYHYGRARKAKECTEGNPQGKKRSREAEPDEQRKRQKPLHT